MSVSQVGENRGLQRPYTHGTFQKRLNDFEELIHEITLQDVEATPEERRQMITENLRYDQFCDSIRSLFGADIRNQDLKALYRKISTNPDAKVDWSELFGYFQSEGDEQETSSTEDVSVFTVAARRRVGDAAGDRKRRDTVQCIRYMASTDSYLTCSQKGALSIWTSKLRLHACADINETAWVTGGDYMPILRRVAVCTERSIAIWDNRAQGKNQSVFTIKPIEHSPQCLAWVPFSGAVVPHEDSLLFGDDQGYVNLVVLSAKDLTMKNSKGDKRYSQNYVIDPNKLSIPMRRRRLHDDWVVKIKYFPELRCFACCSPSSTSSFVLEEVDRICDDGEVRGVSIPKGVNAFDYCARANIIATGGVDKVIRVWHPHIFSRPTGKLIGHLFTIVDICCNEKDQHIISLSTARVFRIWDIHTLTSLQVFTDNEERPGERRIYSMTFDNKHDRLLTGSSVLDAWPLTRAVQDTMQVPHTHDRPVSFVVYNRELNQIVSVCSESVIRVWEADSGRQVYQISEPHGTNTEVTALALDSTGYRLATGAQGGSLKVWDFGSGQEIKWRVGKPSDEDLSVTGLSYCMLGDERYIIAMGWGNQLQILLDSNDAYELTLHCEFIDIYYWSRSMSASTMHSSLSQHKPLPEIGQSPNLTSVYKKDAVLQSHELTCLDALESEYLVTGALNGNTILWNIEKATVEKVFDLETSLPARGNHSSLSSSLSSHPKPAQEHGRAVNAVRFLVHKVRKLDPEFIKKLARGDSYEEEGGDGGEDDKGEKKDEEKAVEDEKNPPSVILSPVASPTQENKSPPGDTKGKEDGENDDAPKVTFDVDADKDEDEENGEGAEVDEDPDSKMIVETFDPVVVTCHQDSFVRFWDLDANLLHEMSAMTRRQGSAVTSLCHDTDCNLLVTGDVRGYLTLWNIAKLLENPYGETKDSVKQLLCWRAHLTKIVQLEYIDAIKAIVSGSVDGSVREYVADRPILVGLQRASVNGGTWVGLFKTLNRSIWWGSKGRFVGFYGQSRPLTFPASEETSSTPVLPYDITEGPLAPVKSHSARQKMQATQRFEYPLVFDNNKWESLETPRAVMEPIPSARDRIENEDQKFFAALVKPRPYNNHLESFKSGEMKQGAVFRALPVYRVRTPPKPKAPEFSYAPSEEDDSSQFLFGGYQQANKGGSKDQNKGGKKEGEGKSKGGKKAGRTGISSSPTNIPSPRRR